MLRDRWQRLRHFGRRSLGSLLRRIRLHRIEYLTLNEIAVVLKRRRWLARWLIPAGNRFLRRDGNRVEALSNEEWLHWERSVDTATQAGIVLDIASSVAPGGSSLACRRIQGASLQQILKDPQVSHEQKQSAVRWALSALIGLHRIAADWGRGVQQRISHGDATTANVIVDLNSQSARWIDFDTRHRPAVPLADRVTDDLRAFIFSVAVQWPVDCFDELAEFLNSAEADSEHLARFRQRLTTEWMWSTTFQLAQAPLTWAARQELLIVLLRHLPPIESRQEIESFVEWTSLNSQQGNGPRDS